MPVFKKLFVMNGQLYVWIAPRAEAVELNLLMVDKKTFVRTFCHRKYNVRKTMCIAAVGAGKMWVALGFAAILGRLEVPRSFLQKSLVDESGFDKIFKCAINGNFVRCGWAKLCGNLFCRYWFAGAQQDG